MILIVGCGAFNRNLSLLETTSIMTNFKRGQIVKFHTPFPEEDPNARYVVLEVREGKERATALVQTGDAKFHFGLTHEYLLKDLEIDEAQTRCLNRYIKRIEEGIEPEVEFWEAMGKPILP